ncbi:MAG: hypothetical protein LQ340_006580 [Diploschistes diacapsis]|nr:MAG: hypothetical protein LQ340_006580 [Diploschistes diacapsis]
MAFPTLASMTTTEAPGASAESSISGGHQASANVSSAEPLSPLEDPELVGVAAANAAKERRLYMTRCMNGREAMRHEDKTWNFMLSQMTDWHGRERSWEGFKRNVEGRKLLGNKFFRRLLP